MGDAGTFLHALDRGIFLVVNGTLQNPVFDLCMPALSDKRLGLLLAAVVVPWLAVRYGRRVWPVILLAVLAVALGDLGAGLIKHAVQRTRPCHVIAEVHLLAGCTRSFAMPSNHASNIFAVAGVLWLGVPAWRWCFLALAAAVGYSRVYLGVHYPSDVLVGAVWGLTVGLALPWAARRLLPVRWNPLGVGVHEEAGRTGSEDADTP